jgi:2,4-dienoyl-CoA reductase (NADPH2)
LDHVFKQKRASCLVNPVACYETELHFNKVVKPKRIAVVGAGPAGLAFSVYSAQRGHNVTLFDKASEIGGQFNFAKQVPGKEEFYETLRYFNEQLKKHEVTVNLSIEVSAQALLDEGFDEVVLATGIIPRKLDLKGFEHPKVKSYLNVLRDKEVIGNKVAIIGAGGIGFDVACYLAEEKSLTNDADAWMKNWGVDKSYQGAGALLPKAEAHKSEREIYLLQRKETKVGAGLGKTTGWIHRATLQKNNVHMIPGVTYKEVNDKGLLISVNGEEKLLEVDNVIICAGQQPERALYQTLVDAQANVHLIGGANVAAELDAKRAIRQAAELASLI